MIKDLYMKISDFKISNHFFVFLKFGLVGGTTAAIYFLVMWVAQSVLMLYYVISVSVAYLFSSVFHFLANRHYTFGAVKDRHERQLIRYLTVWLFNYAITLAIVGICVELFHLSSYLGVCVAVVFTTLISYALSRYWVFKIKENT